MHWTHLISSLNVKGSKLESIGLIVSSSAMWTCLSTIRPKSIGHKHICNINNWKESKKEIVNWIVWSSFGFVNVHIIIICFVNHTQTHTHLTCETRCTFLRQQRSGAFPSYRWLRDPICLLSSSPGLGDWVCETDNRLSIPSQQRQEATYTPQGLNPVSMYFMDGSHRLKTDSWEWMESEEAQFVWFFLTSLCV